MKAPTTIPKLNPPTRGFHGNSQPVAIPLRSTTPTEEKQKKGKREEKNEDTNKSPQEASPETLRSDAVAASVSFWAASSVVDQALLGKTLGCLQPPDPKYGRPKKPSTPKTMPEQPEYCIHLPSGQRNLCPGAARFNLPVLPTGNKYKCER